MRKSSSISLDQGGQSLAEFVLCVPVILLLIVGLIQIGSIGIVVGFSHYAAHCALRSYTVFYAQGKKIAIQKAGSAMEQAMAWCRPETDLDLEISEEKPNSGDLHRSKYNGDGPLLFTATITAHVPLLIAMGDEDSIPMTVISSMLSEKTVESDE